MATLEQGLNTLHYLYITGCITEKDEREVYAMLVDSRGDALDALVYQMEEWVHRAQGRGGVAKGRHTHRMLMLLLLSITCVCIGINVAGNVHTSVPQAPIQSNTK
jgi:hypothetical protein